MVADLIGGDPTAQLAKQLAPGPGPAAGAPQPAPGAPGPAAGAPPPNQAPSATTQPDPQTQNLTEALLRVHQRDQAIQGFNEGLEGIAASFGTAGQQAAKRAAIGRDQGQGDTLQAIRETQQITGEQTKQSEHARAGAGAELYGTTVLGLKPGQPTELFNSGVWGDVIQSHATPTEAMKNVDAATAAYAAAHPEATAADIAQQKDAMLSAIASGGDTTQREMQAAARSWKNDPANKDQPLPVRFTDPAEWKAYVGQLGEDQKVIGQAKSSFSADNARLDPVEQNINWLVAHPDAAIKAIHQPEGTSGWLGKILGGVGPFGAVSGDTLSARSRLDWLGQQLYSTNFKGGQRLSQQEASRLGAAFTTLMGENARNMSDDDVRNELSRLSETIKTARGNTFAAAGKEVPIEYQTKDLNRDFFDPHSTLHSGATLAKAATVNSPDDIARLPHGTPFIIPSGPHKGETGYAQ
jgi:hypothetical protein